MNPENLPKSEPEQYDPNLEAQDEEVASGGNNRLLYILVAVIAVFVIGYIALPKGQGSGMAAVTPTFMLDDAAVTATSPTAVDSLAAGFKKAPTAATPADVNETKTLVKTVAPARPAAAAPAAPVATVAAAAAPAPAAPEPVAAPAAAPEPAAPANVTMSGKIEDENGRPLVGATVILKGSNKGTSTDGSGNYTLEVPGGSENTLVYGYGGYEDEVVRNSGNKPVNVTLTPRAKISRKRR